MTNLDATVLAALRTVPTASGPSGLPATRFGSKVFITALAAALPAGTFADVAALRRYLVDANRRRVLTLVRLDLVSACDFDAVSQSEFSDRGADYHAVLDER